MAGHGWARLGRASRGMFQLGKRLHFGLVLGQARAGGIWLGNRMEKGLASQTC